MSTQKVAAWSHAEDFVAPSEHIEEARHRGEELGAESVGNGVGAVLQMLAAAIGAKAVMEIGTGAGASGLWLLGGRRHLFEAEMKEDRRTHGRRHHEAAPRDGSEQAP